MNKPKPAKKGKRKIIILRVLGCILIFLQILGHLNHPSDRSINDNLSEQIGHFIGYNIFLWIALCLFYWSWSVSKKNKKTENTESIESIGTSE
jgi:hypothetical protein